MVEKYQYDKPDGERPSGIKVLCILLLLISFFYLVKFIHTISRWSLLADFPLTISPSYLAFDGLIWFLAGMILAAGLWTGKSWAKPAAQFIVPTYSLIFWADRIWIAEPENLTQRWPVYLVFTLIYMGSTFLILNHPSSKSFFSQNTAKIP